MVEHVVATTINHGGFEDSVVDAGLAHSFFGAKLRFVIGRAAVRTSAEEAEQEKSPDTCTARRLDDVTRALDMDALIAPAKQRRWACATHMPSWW